MLLLWLGSFALAASPQLHHWLHEDSDNPTHDCFVVQLQQQPLLSDSLPLMVAAPSHSVLQLTVCGDLEPISPPRHLFSPSRAPPRQSTPFRAVV